jgi:NAD(P)-dependent dehydrogenase (short-subunit alcohol dehydrogenase family)
VEAFIVNKTVVVTGAGRGLGYCITQRHVQQKDKVYALEYQISEALRTLEEENPNLHVACCDVGDDASVAEAVKPLIKSESRLDIIYSVAGIFSFAGRVGLAKTETDMGMQTYNVNALGTLRVCREVWSLIQKDSLVLIVSSEAGSIGAAQRKAEYAYCMSKAALNMLGKLLSNELWEQGGRVLCIHPGWLRTQMGGEDARNSTLSIEPELSAEHIVALAERIDTIPRDQLFMTHLGEILPW